MSRTAKIVSVAVLFAAAFFLFFRQAWEQSEGWKDLIEKLGVDVERARKEQEEIHAEFDRLLVEIDGAALTVRETSELLDDLGRLARDDEMAGVFRVARDLTAANRREITQAGQTIRTMRDAIEKNEVLLNGVDSFVRPVVNRAAGVASPRPASEEVGSAQDYLQIAESTLLSEAGIVSEFLTIHRDKLERLRKEKDSLEEMLVRTENPRDDKAAWARKAVELAYGATSRAVEIALKTDRSMERFGRAILIQHELVRAQATVLSAYGSARGP